MMRTVRPAEPEQPEELAIMVHGTFAGDDADSGDKWWQPGSQEALELQRRLPVNVRVAEGDEVFHWSGENGERARSKAAKQLLDHLRPLEAAGRSYHLVGHSHGGSVIWNALRMATLAGKPLDGLKSWTTVGTPFLHQSSHKPWHTRNLLGVAVGLALVRPAFTAAYELAGLMWEAASGRKAAIFVKTDEQLGYWAVLRAPFVALGERLGVSVERTSEHIRLGHYDPEGNVSMLQYLFATSEGLILLCLLFLCMYVFLHLSILCVRPAIESLRMLTENRLQQRAFRRYGPSWLGLWSPDDEAINGLRATLDLSMSFVKRMVPNDRVFLTDNLSLVSRPYFWVLAPLFNRFLRPVIDSHVRGVLIRSAQGNDRPTAQVVAVLPTPVAEADDAPPLPEMLQRKILDEADRHAGSIAPKLRQLLGCPSFSSGLEAFSAELSGKELVHTSYFNHPEVLELISCNVRWAANGKIATTAATSGGRPLIRWFQAFKKVVATDEPQPSTPREIPPPYRDLVPPRRRKVG